MPRAVDAVHPLALVAIGETITRQTARDDVIQRRFAQRRVLDPRSGRAARVCSSQSVVVAHVHVQELYIHVHVYERIQFNVIIT